MDLHPLQWHDFVRVITFSISLYCVVTLAIRYKQNHDDWNRKTLDYWYALTMWCCAGVVVTAQAIVLNRPFTPGFVFLTAAILVTGKGVHRKGEWGGKSA